MPRTTEALPRELDVLVIGTHASSALAAAALARSGVRVARVMPPGEPAPRRPLVVNPALFSLDPLLEPLGPALPAQPVFGVRLLGDRAGVSSEWASEASQPLAIVVDSHDATAALATLASPKQVPTREARSLAVEVVDEQGVRVAIDGKSVIAKLAILSDPLDETSLRLLGVPREWERGTLRRYTFLDLGGRTGFQRGERPVLPMSLDLAGTLSWGWLLPTKNTVVAAVEQPVEQAGSGTERLGRFIDLLLAHKVVKDVPMDIAGVQTIDLPFAGALERDCVANRTLLIGPVGGFVSGAGEELYPSCWSALSAARTAATAVKATHPQDALTSYRDDWGATLGDYLRGPQQNLKFLLPLAYRNAAMTRRLAEAILSGQGVVR